MEIILSILTAIVNTALGLITLFKNPKSDTNRIFAILAFILGVWSITNYLSLHASTPAEQLFWIRVVMFGGAFMGSGVFLLIRAFPNHKISLPLWLHFSIWIFSSFIGLLALLTPLVFSDITYVNGSIQPTPGMLMPLYAIHFLGFMIWGFILLGKKYLKAQSIEKIQFRFLILGLATTFSLIAFFNFIVVNLFQNTTFVSLGPSFTLILVIATFYAIIKHRFLDIKLIVIRAVVYALLLLLLGLIYIFAIFVVGGVLFNIQTSIHEIILYSLFTLITALTFGQIKKIFEKATDKIFFKGKYDLSKLLSDLAHITSTTIDLKKLTNDVLEKLALEIRFVKGSFILFDSQKVYDVITYGPASGDENINYNYQSLSPMLNYTKILIFDELPEGTLKSFMRNLNINVLVTLTVQQEVIGILVLSEKASGDLYSEQDIKILEIVSSEVAVAIQNAKSYDKIKKFNLILTDEVEKATKDLQNANNRLKELDRLKDDFVSIASHELRTPMTAIRSYAWMALYKSDIPLSERLKRYLSRTLISTERLINLVNDMLNISRIESGRVEILPKSFSILELVKDVVIEVAEKAKEKNINLVINPTPLPSAFADPDKVHQVLLNLIGNALKFTPQNGTITINFYSDNKIIETSIKDNGVGISNEDLIRLFKKFGRLDNSYVAAATSGGTGLGLFICKSLIELMQGKITAHSDGLNKGSTFTFSLPVASTDILKDPQKYTNKVKGEAKFLEPVAI